MIFNYLELQLMDLDPLFIYFNRPMRIILKILVLTIPIVLKKKKIFVLSAILSIHEWFYIDHIYKLLHRRKCKR